MPAGCEFICKNENCQCYNTGFVMTAPWPMSNINLVINSSTVKEKPEFRKKLIELRDSGKTFACIQLPNIDKVKAESYRVQFWDNNLKRVIEKYSKNSDVIDDEILEEKVQNNYMDFTEATTDGIICPHCLQKLFQSRWSTND